MLAPLTGSPRVRRPLERYLPVLYFGLAIGLTAAMLPTALRPPPQQPPTSARLSPDTPPDDNNEVVITELGRSTTSTAGSGLQVASEQRLVPGPLAGLRPRKGLCFGDPPRQTESIYSPPCVSAFTGDNGGATWRGVTATEVRWAIIRDSGYSGPIDQRNPADATANDRTWRVWEQYLNDNFELY